jgi:exodeoxyribonuclease VII large subunit
MTPDGEGDLLAALQKIKEKLGSEGLFAPERKKPLPQFPKKVGVITSETGAAVRDIFNVLSRRYPLCDIVFCPATVQGPLAPPSLCSALDKIEKSGVDVIIIGRGGGSMEDLWCFNDEVLARRIAACEIPVISAVGHEIDFTICDFVSDLRAPTPSAAAELAVPDVQELSDRLSTLASVIKSRTEDIILSRQKSLEVVMASRVFAFPVDSFCQRRILLLDALIDKVDQRLHSTFERKEKDFCVAASKLDALSPIKTLIRGYSVAQKEGAAVKSVNDLATGDKIALRLSDGSAECVVNNVTKE